jgi:hypothetical protein
MAARSNAIEAAAIANDLPGFFLVWAASRRIPLAFPLDFLAAALPRF